MKENNINNNEPENIAAESTEKVLEETSKPKKNWKKDILEILESTFITVFVIVLIFTYLLHPVNVKGHSMEPTLFADDRIFMTTITTGISYGDIVVINNDAAYLLDEAGNIKESDPFQLNECIIKRVIGCPGQTIDIDFSSGEVSIDDKVLDEPYINEVTQNNDGAFEYPLTIPEGYYFVMGDNRNQSSDSRNMYVGLIKEDQIYGKAIIRYLPDFTIL